MFHQKQNRQPKNSSLHWLSSLDITPQHIEMLPEHADTRAYFRIRQENSTSILVESNKPESDCQYYQAITEAHLKAKLPVPNILAAQIGTTNSTFLITDFGDLTLLNALNDPQHFDQNQLYQASINLIHQYQKSQLDSQTTLSRFDSNLALKQMLTGLERFSQTHDISVNFNKIETTLIYLANFWKAIPTAPTHVDFHSANIMIKKHHDPCNSLQLGLLDYQDCIIGPINYDLVSLITDHYYEISWSQRLEWIHQFYDTISHRCPNLTRQYFLTSCYAVTLQRHLKNIGIFSILATQGKSSYGQLIPKMLKVIETCCYQLPKTDGLRALCSSMSMLHHD